MKHAILGTAGHIDHGKTALVKTLTGIDTDRLKEEKERGITTELGFTFLDLPNGTRLGIIDVPGHERFVKHMVAGVWGIDLVALIIAADEGVMPQTREHLDICRLLKVKKGLVVITKIDLIEEDLLEMVREEVIDLVKDSFLEGAPIIPVSSVTRKGIPELIATLDHLSEGLEERTSKGLLRLPIDRVFVMKGFGTVVTGTMISGSLSIGELVEILPAGLEGKVRNLQVYNRSVEKAVAGERTAVNLQGLEASTVERGEVLVHTKTLLPTRILDVYLEYLPGSPRPLRSRTMQRFHIGTNLALATIFLLDQEELIPGQGGFAQLRLEQPVVAMPKDRFVIRGSSAIQTIGGGVVLDTHPSKHKRFSPSVLEDLTVLRVGSGEEVLQQHVLRSGSGGMTRSDLLNRVPMAPDEMEALLKKMTEKGDLLVVDPEKLKVIAISQYQRLKEMSLGQLKEFHQRFPMKSGLSKEELRTRLPDDVDMKLFQILIQGLLKTNGVVLEKDKLRLSEHQISSLDEKGLITKVEEAMRGGALQPPSPRELAEKWNEKEEEVLAISEHLVHEGVLVKVKNGIYFHRTHFEKLKEELVTFLRRDKEITTPQFKELTGVSRKYAIPLIEYFDQMKVTLRLGEKRVLRAGKESAKSDG